MAPLNLKSLWRGRRGRRGDGDTRFVRARRHAPLRRDSRRAPDGLRRLSEGTQECATHALAIGEAGFACDDVDWQLTLLHQEPCGFDAEVFDRLRRRLPRLRAERTAELPRTEICDFGELFHRQWRFQVASSVTQRALDAIRFRV